MTFLNINFPFSNIGRTALFSRAILRLTQNRVIRGPFKDLEYHKSIDSYGETLTRLLGIYEKELHEIISQEVVPAGFEEIFVIGGNDGYYPVGFARTTSAKIITYEMNPVFRNVLEKNARGNGVMDRISIRGECNPSNLKDSLSPEKKSFVLCDIEGYEMVLLDPAKVPGLEKSWLLVEDHNFAHNGITEALMTRFGHTHHIRGIVPQLRSKRDFPKSLKCLMWRLFPQHFIDAVLSDCRHPGTVWLWMVPGHS
ncbi:MAG: hypothetical protein HQM09_09760 [Candidatus Riflebacteria bacterium]|nr:hypothetical protein [Candidatus Riflebacteria bacterium]